MKLPNRNIRIDIMAPVNQSLYWAIYHKHDDGNYYKLNTYDETLNAWVPYQDTFEQCLEYIKAYSMDEYFDERYRLYPRKIKTV